MVGYDIVNAKRTTKDVELKDVLSISSELYTVESITPDETEKIKLFLKPVGYTLKGEHSVTLHKDASVIIQATMMHSKTAEEFRRGDYVMIKGKPCRLVELSKSK